jgi:hypothetical protein
MNAHSDSAIQFDDGGIDDARQHVVQADDRAPIVGQIADEPELIAVYTLRAAENIESGVVGIRHPGVLLRQPEDRCGQRKPPVVHVPLRAGLEGLVLLRREIGILDPEAAPAGDLRQPLG